MAVTNYIEQDPYQGLLDQYKAANPFVAPTMSTNTPPVAAPAPVPAAPVPTMSTNTPPVLAPQPVPTATPVAAPAPTMFPAVTTGGNQPPAVAPNPTNQPQPRGGFAPAQVALDTAGQILDSEGAYMSNARRRGLESAASRGLANSSIAAGSSQRAAIDAAAPLISNALNLQGQREQLAFQGEQAGLGRTQEFNMAKVEDWLGSRQFSREFNGALAMMPIQSAYQLNSLIQNYALDNPEVYTPQVINGMSNFFNQNFLQVLQSYFPAYNGEGP